MLIIIELVYYSAALVALAFVVLVIFIVRTLTSVKGTLENVSKNLDSLEKQMNNMTNETTEILKKSNQMVDDVQVVVNSVKDVGVTIQKFNNVLKKSSERVESEKVVQVVQWSQAAIDIWQRMKARKLTGLPKNKEHKKGDVYYE